MQFRPSRDQLAVDVGLHFRSPPLQFELRLNGCFVATVCHQVVRVLLGNPLVATRNVPDFPLLPNAVDYLAAVIGDFTPPGFGLFRIALPADDLISHGTHSHLLISLIER